MAACIYRSKNIATPAMAEPGRVCMLSNLGKIWAFEITTLAKAGWHHEQPEYWMEEAPASVVELVERERTGNETGVR
ncbi:hypothetical protein Golax_010802, partial [Gossypium laxum]|nr:hypothetical protein [Gossypium laxum]